MSKHVHLNLNFLSAISFLVYVYSYFHQLLLQRERFKRPENVFQIVYRLRYTFDFVKKVVHF